MTQGIQIPGQVPNLDPRARAALQQQQAVQTALVKANLAAAVGSEVLAAAVRSACAVHERTHDPFGLGGGPGDDAAESDEGVDVNEAVDQAAKVAVLMAERILAHCGLVEQPHNKPPINGA